MSESLDRDEWFTLFGRSVDGTLSAAEHARLEAILSTSETARRLWYEFSDLETGLAEWSAAAGQVTESMASVSFRSSHKVNEQRSFLRFGYSPYVAAAAILCLLTAWLLRTWSSSEPVNEGVAVLTRSVDAEWSTATGQRSAGAVLGPDTIRLNHGAVQLDFYSGARVILEGPAEVHLVSTMEVKLVAGRIRAHVPPQADGFVVDGPDFRVVDRGTEFGVAVNPDAAEVHVFAGRVDIASADQPQTLRTLTAGHAVQHASHVWSESEADTSAFLDETKIAEQESRRAQTRFEAWRVASEAIDRESSAVLHYWFDASRQKDEQFGFNDVVNRVAGVFPTTTGRIVGCEWVQGRWPTSRALQWCGEGDRIRFRCEQPLHQVSFLAWVRVPHLRDGLSGLVCADGDTVGSLHWEISRSGQLRLAIARDLGRSRTDWEAVDSRPFITSDRFGQWIQLVTTFDGATICHYGNGEPIGSGAAFRPPTLLLGTADVGNSGGRVVRAFPGAIDELMILSRVIGPDEVRTLYEQGKH
jgi:ferric-dicitrate binding protein FerR (iron transport regulator)